MEQVGVGLIVLLAIFTWMAWRSNIESNLSWEKMRRTLTPTDYGSIGWKVSTVKGLIEQATYPTFENGYYHNLIHGGR